MQASHPHDWSLAGRHRGAAIHPICRPAHPQIQLFLTSLSLAQADTATATIRTRKFLTNRLLKRKQFVRPSTCAFWLRAESERLLVTPAFVFRAALFCDL